MTAYRPVTAIALAAALASSTAEVSAGADPYTISHIDPAQAAAFRISDVGAAPIPGDNVTDGSDETPVAPEDLFKISDISPS